MSCSRFALQSWRCWPKSLLSTKPSRSYALSDSSLVHQLTALSAAYIYNKSSHGNLPSETLAKVLAIQRKLVLQHGPVPATSPVGRAFEAAKSQLLQANRRWITMGPRAFGALGEIGSASSDDARIAWTKATDGKVKTFDDGTRGGTIAIDAGRVVGPQRQPNEAPPQYEPPEEEMDEVTGEVEGVLAGKTQQEIGRAHV